MHRKLEQTRSELIPKIMLLNCHPEIQISFLHDLNFSEEDSFLRVEQSLDVATAVPVVKERTNKEPIVSHLSVG